MITFIVIRRQRLPDRFVSVQSLCQDHYKLKVQSGTGDQGGLDLPCCG